MASGERVESFTGNCLREVITPFAVSALLAIINVTAVAADCSSFSSDCNVSGTR